MNENIDLTKILKDCPKWTKLYTPIWGEVTFIEVRKNENCLSPIRIYNECSNYVDLDKKGRYFNCKGDEECILFPSKYQRDWSKFTAPWYKKEPEPKFKVGDWVVNKFGDSWHIVNLDKKNYQVSDGKGNYNYFPISKQDEMHLWTIQDAKDGDILACNEEILLFKSYSKLQGRISLYCWYNGHTNNFHSKEVIDILLTTRNKVYPATKEQRDLLFQKIKEAGYKWNVKTKTLDKLVKPKFDPKTLKPFDKVLVRDNDSDFWRCSFYSHERKKRGNTQIQICNYS